MSSFYAVAKGRSPGVYKSWSECSSQVKGFSSAIYKKFETENAAFAFVNLYHKDTSVSKPNIITEHKKTQIQEKPTLNSINIKKERANIKKERVGVSLPWVQVPNKPDIPLEYNSIIVFTDGSCPSNGQHKTAGYAAVFPYHEFLYTGGKLLNKNATNNRAEYTAFIVACDRAELIDPDRNKTLHVYTDSNILIQTATIWIKKWRKNGWRKSDGTLIANMDLVKEINNIMLTRKVQFTHVKAHTNNSDWKSTWNDIADKMARHYAMI